MYFLYKSIFLDSVDKQYKHIITISHPYPPGLKPLIRVVKMPKLSLYTTHERICSLYAFHSFIDASKIMPVDELPTLISYILSQHYTIDYKLSELLKDHSQHNNSTILAFY